MYRISKMRDKATDEYEDGVGTINGNGENYITLDVQDK